MAYAIADRKTDYAVALGAALKSMFGGNVQIVGCMILYDNAACESDNPAITSALYRDLIRRALAASQPRVGRESTALIGRSPCAGECCPSRGAMASGQRGEHGNATGMRQEATGRWQARS